MLRAALLAVAATAAVAPAAALAAPVRAGAAAADMTPPVGTPQFAYTARSYVFDPGPQAADRAVQLVDDFDTAMYAKTFEPSTGIHTRVYARAIVLEQGGQKYALAMADLGGLPYALTQTVLDKLAGTGIDADHLLLSATHTHSSTGPIWPADNSGYGFVGGDAFDPRIFELTASSIAEAIRGADDRLEPARVGVGTAELHDASRNREYEVYLRDHDLPADPAQQRAQSIDPTVTVVRVDDAQGRPLGLWSNFAIHGTSLGDDNHLLSGDNMSVSERLAEREIADTVPAARRRAVVNVWTNGAEGDTSPDGDNRTIAGEKQFYIADGDSAAKAHMAGIRTAKGIVAAWEDAGRDMTATPQIDARRTLLKLDGTKYGPDAAHQEPVGPFPVLGFGVVAETRPSLTAAIANQDPGAEEPNCAPVDGLAGPGQGLKMPLVGGPGIAPDTFPVSLWRIGRQGIAAYPAEITKQMGQRIRDALVHDSAGALDRVAIAGLTNGYISYTATPEEYDACTYEGSFTLFGRQEGYAWLATGARLEQALLTGKPVTGSAAEPIDEGFGTTQSTPLRTTAAAGAVVTQPTDVRRYERATFTWQGGDPQVDAARGRTFVALQRLEDGAWTTVDTDDSYNDSVTRAKGDIWTETYQFDRCTPPDSYRFHVTGRAVRSLGAAATDYTVDSATFSVAPLTIQPGSATVVGDSLELRPLYPDPGASPLALPRLVSDATIKIAGGPTLTAPDADGVYRAPAVYAGRPITVNDECGNDTA
jgi:neutral ceramidase